MVNFGSLYNFLDAFKITDYVVDYFYDAEDSFDTV